MVTEHLLITDISCVVCTMQENQFLLFLNHLRLPYSIPKSFALLLNIHIARHTAACYLLNKGLGLDIVAKIMGHSSTKLTKHYAKLLDKTVFRVVDEVMNKAKTEGCNF